MINAKRLILSITFPLAKLLNLYFVFMQMSSNKLIPSCSKLRRLVVFAYGLERFFVDEVLDDRGRGGRVINDEIPQEAKNQIDVFYQMLSSNCLNTYSWLIRASVVSLCSCMRNIRSTQASTVMTCKRKL